MRRALILSLVVLGALAPAAAAQAPRIRPSVLVAGVDVGNLTRPEARAGLRAAFAAAYSEPVTVTAAGRRFTLGRKAVRFRFDAWATVQQAYAAGVASPPAADGSVVPVAVAPVVRFKRKPIGAWIRSLRAKVRRKAVDATIGYGIRRIARTRPRAGRVLRTAGLHAAVSQALADPASPRVLAPGTRRTLPRIGWKELPGAHPVILTIEQSTFTLRVFKRLKLARTYRVAVGQPAYPTPNGTFAITSKQVNPTWTAPNSPWAGELAGQSIAGGAADNPLKARWMGLAGGVGIHGTGQPWSIGTRASHGCIRMTVPDVIALFDQVPLGAPVFIG